MNKQDIQFQFGHLGINTTCPEQAQQLARYLCALFALPTQDGSSSVYSGKQIEIMKTPGRGTHGHICILTNDLPGAIEMLEARGVAFDRTAFKYDGAGQLLAAYLREEVCGFALHLSENGC